VSYFHSIEPFARRLLTWTSFVILLAMIALHVGLVDVGQWTDDEFLIIGSYRGRAWAAFCDRLISWSPRPISEGLIWAYGCLVNWTHKPFIGFSRFVVGAANCGAIDFVHAGPELNCLGIHKKL
jgi:hypothetical protein